MVAEGLELAAPGRRVRLLQSEDLVRAAPAHDPKRYSGSDVSVLTEGAPSTDNGLEREPWSACGELHDDGAHCGIIDMQHMLALPPDVFDIDDEDWYEDEFGEEDSSEKFVFTRRVRGSVMLGMGNTTMGRTLQPAAPASTHISSVGIEAVYTKTSDEHSKTIFLAVVIGVGVLDLSRAVAHCGYVPGLLLIVAFGCLQAFLCARVTEVPHFLSTNLESYGDIAKVAVHKYVYHFIVLLVVTNWFGMCSVYLTNILKAVDTNFCKNAKCIGPGPKICCGLLVTPLIFRTDAHHLRRASIVSLGSMFALAAIEGLCAVKYGLDRWADDDRRVMIASSADCTDGIHHFLLPFSGTAIVPYLVAEMKSPLHAKRVIYHSCAIMVAFYSAVGVICYFGWGKDILDRDPIKVLYAIGKQDILYYVAGVLMSALFMVKTLATVPLFFWPLCREIDSWLAREERPEVKLLLPWAVRGLQLEKHFTRVFLLFLIICPTLLPEYEPFQNFIVAVPVNSVHFLLPAVFAVGAIYTHTKALANSQHQCAELRRTRAAPSPSMPSRYTRQPTRSGRSRGVPMAAPPKELYILLDPSKHLAVTVAVAAVVCSASAFIFFRWAVFQKKFVADDIET